nr:hypothetical protein 1 [Forsythia suspensa tombusvirus]
MRWLLAGIRNEWSVVTSRHSAKRLATLTLPADICNEVLASLDVIEDSTPDDDAFDIRAKDAAPSGQQNPDGKPVVVVLNVGPPGPRSTPRRRSARMTKKLRWMLVEQFPMRKDTEEQRAVMAIWAFDKLKDSDVRIEHRQALVSRAVALCFVETRGETARRLANQLVKHGARAPCVAG